MSAPLFPSPNRAPAAIVFAAFLLASPGAYAKTTGVGDDAAVQSGPCYQALVDKNAANPTTAPNRELGAACEAEHGDVEKAWARVMRLWGSDSTDVPDYDSYRHADAPVDGSLPRWLAVAGLLLTYLALGTPMRGAARLMGALPGSASGATIDTVVCLVSRGLIVGLSATLFTLPYVATLGGLALIGWIVMKTIGTAPERAVVADEAVSSGLSAHLAEAINDVLGAGLGLVAIALFVQRDFLMLALALALALVASAGPAIRARSALRAFPMVASAAAASLVAALGEVVILTPAVSGWITGLTGAGVVVPLAMAILTLAMGWRADRGRAAAAN